jgi:hypothetical protein
VGMISKVFPLAIGMVSVLGTTGVLAQQNQKQTESMLSLITAGYEIKSVYFIPIDALKPLGYDPTVAPQLVITLQKAASTAACTFQANNWGNQNPVTLEDPTLCVAYNFK